MKRDRVDDEGEGNKKHKRRKSKQKDKSGKSGLKLMLYAALGEVKKVRKLLDKYPAPDVNTYDGEGNTALHQAARFGHVDVVEALLDGGADPRAEDLRGNTPAHIAAAKGHLTVLSSILKASKAPDVDLPNSDGVTIRQLTDAALERKDIRAMADERRRGPEEAAVPSEDEDWDEKMRREAHEDGVVDEDVWGSYDAPDEDDFTHGPFGARTGPPMDENEYARFIWEEMSRRKSGVRASKVGPMIEEHWKETTRLTSERERKARAAEDAKERSRRILEEERAKDAAWREAVLRGDLGARRAGYEARWHIFAQGTAPIRYAEIPWLVEELDDARAIILYGTSGPEEVRRRVRTELMRWHPDKFVSKFGLRLLPGEHERILDKVKHISQMLTGLNVS